MDSLLGLLVEAIRTFLPVIIWDMLVRKINEAEAKRQKAELEKSYLENKHKVLDEARGKSARELLNDAIKSGNDTPGA